jgi:hypothetical protein
MQKSFALLAVLASTGLAGDAISATVQQCNSRNNTCFGICAQKKGGFDAQSRCGARKPLHRPVRAAGWSEEVMNQNQLCWPRGAVVRNPERATAAG